MRVIFYTIIGLALGWWEGVVVVYIREILTAIQPNLTKLTILQLSKPLIVTGNKGYSLLFIEKTREITPIVIIFCLSVFCEKKFIRKLAILFCGFLLFGIYFII